MRKPRKNVPVLTPRRIHTFTPRSPSWGVSGRIDGWDDADELPEESDYEGSQRQDQLVDILEALDDHQDRLEEACEKFMIDRMSEGEIAEFHRRKYVQSTLEAARYAGAQIEKRCEQFGDRDEEYDIQNNIDRRQWKDYIAKVYESGGLFKRTQKRITRQKIRSEYHLERLSPEEREAHLARRERSSHVADAGTNKRNYSAKTKQRKREALAKNMRRRRRNRVSLMQLQK